MKRYKINELEKIVSEDLNDLQKTIHESLYDKILYPFLKSEDGVLGDSFTVTRLSATQVSVESGRGFKYDGTQVSPEPKYRAMDLAADLTLTINAGTWAALPSAGNSRYDLILVRPSEVVVATESRYVKNALTGLVSSETVDKILEQQAEFSVYEGVEGGSPAVPATPVGWMKVAEILVSETGIDSAGSVIDTRNVLLPAIQTFSEFDRYVAPSGVGTDTTLAAAVSNLPVGGGCIYVMENCTLGTVLSVPANVNIVGKTRETRITLLAGGEIDLSDNSALVNITIYTAETAVVPMLDIAGDSVLLESVIFDVPVAAANTVVNCSGDDLEIRNCVFKNCDSLGTNIALVDTGSKTLSIGSGSYVEKFNDVITHGAGLLTLKNYHLKSVILVDTTAGVSEIKLPPPKKGTVVIVKDKVGLFSTYSCTVKRYAAENIEGLGADYVCESSFGVWVFVADATNWSLI